MNGLLTDAMNISHIIYVQNAQQFNGSDTITYVRKGKWTMYLNDARDSYWNMPHLFDVY